MIMSTVFSDSETQNKCHSNLLSEYLELISKTVKGDTRLIEEILFNGLSSYTELPNHLMIIDKSSEGKTYPVLEIAKHFPKENVIVLESATPQIFKYEYGVPVDQNFMPILPKLEQIDDEIEAKKGNKITIKTLREKKSKLLENSRTLIDLRNKWIIFKEPPPHKLLEVLYSTLSADEKYSQHKFVDTSRKGNNKTDTVILMGTPSILICSTRDESKNPRWEETLSRFNVISPVSSKEKYLEGMQLIGQRNGLPKFLFEENVIGKEDCQRIKEITTKFINLIQKHNGEIFNPFQEQLAKQFPQETGNRWRQFQRLNNLIRLHTLLYSENRPLIVYGDQKIPITIKSDVVWAMNFLKENEFVAPHKLKWFHNVFVKSFESKCQRVSLGNYQEHYLKNVVTASDIVVYCKEKGIQVKSTKQIREGYLDDLCEHGLVEHAFDTRNNTRFVYWPSGIFENDKSPSNVISSFDASGVNSCLNRYLKQRFEYEYKGIILNQDEMITNIMS